MAAVGWAARHAAVRNRPLTIVFVKDWLAHGSSLFPMWGPPGEAAVDESARSVVAEAATYASKLAPECPIKTEIVDGSPVKDLVERGSDAALLVVGRRGTGGFLNLALGSTALRVARHATVPVAVVPVPPTPAAKAKDEPAPSDSPESAGRLVVGVDASVGAQAALDWAFSEASMRGLELVAVRAWSHPVYDAPALDVPFPPLPDDYVAEQRRVLAEAMAGWQEKFPDVSVDRLVFNEHPVRSLLSAADGADLLVVGARGEGGVYHALLGSVSEAIIRHAACPVVVVHPASSEVKGPAGG